MESNRLQIRPSVFEDCALFAKWEALLSVRSGFTMNDDWDYSKIAHQFVVREEDKTHAQMTILLKETGAPIGRIQISKINNDYDSLDITRFYIASDEDRRRGLGEEAMHLILEYCFIQLHMERVTLDYIDGNHPAEMLYLKLGFTKEGIARHGGKKNGMYLDFHMMSMLRNEYYSHFKSEEL